MTPYPEKKIAFIATKMRRSPALPIFAAAILFSTFQTAKADDGLAAIQNGVITFSKTDDIVMQEETLILSIDRIKATFTFLNISAKAQDLLIAFPIPDIDTATNDGLDIPVKDNDNFVGFQTKVDGKTVSQGLEIRAFLPDGKEVTGILKTHEIPLVRPYWTLVDSLKALPEDTQRQLIAAGAIEGEVGDVSPRWIAKSKFFFGQTFLPGTPVRIEHAYKPSLDISKMSFYSADMAPSPEQIATYCLTPAIASEITVREAKAAQSVHPHMAQYSIGYILSTAKTWAGPIGRFRLIVEKQNENQIASFCLPLQQTSPTRYEMERQDFVPDRDLDVVFFE